MSCRDAAAVARAAGVSAFVSAAEAAVEVVVAVAAVAGAAYAEVAAFPEPEPLWQLVARGLLKRPGWVERCRPAFQVMATLVVEVSAMV